MTQERRRYPRFETAGLNGSLVHSLDAKVLNLSLAGVAVETTSQVAVGNELAIGLARDDERFEMTGTVRWCHLAGTQKSVSGEVQPLYHAGLAFADVLSDNARNILSFLESSLVIDVETRLFGRVDLPQDQPVVLTADHDLAVKKISLSGMLIETGLGAREGEQLSIELTLGGRTIRPTGQVVSVAKVTVDKRRLRHHLGLEFVGLEDGERQAIGAFIREELGGDPDAVATG